MRTTVDLPDALARKVKMAAIQRGVNFKTLMTQALEHELDPSVQKRAEMPVQFPLIRSRKPGAYKLSPTRIHDILVREEVAAYETAQRR